MSTPQDLLIMTRRGIPVLLTGLELIMGGGMAQVNSLKILGRRRYCFFPLSYFSHAIGSWFDVVYENSGMYV